MNHEEYDARKRAFGRAKTTAYESGWNAAEAGHKREPPDGLMPDGFLLVEEWLTGYDNQRSYAAQQAPPPTTLTSDLPKSH